MRRRFFLKSAAGTLLAAPFLTSLREPALAQAPAPPRRSVIFHSPCGCLTNRWFPKVEDGPLDADALAGTTVQVLTPWIDKLLFPRGLRAVNQYGKPQFIDPHVQANAGKLTCSLVDESSSHYALSHSLDHEIARQINPRGAAPLVVGPKASTLAVEVLSYSAPGVVFPLDNSPRHVFDQLSGLIHDSTGETEYQHRRRLSILDAVRDDLATYRRQDMSRSDQRRVEAWLSLLRETEQGVTECNPERLGVDPANLGGDTTAGLEAGFTVEADLMIQLMALALLCDLNRSMILTFPGFAVFDWDGIHFTKDHDGLAHRSGDFTGAGNCVEGVIEMLDQIDHWYANKFSKLVDLFGRLPEGDGALLDNTATMWIQEFSDGNAMNLNNMPIVIAGSAGGYLKQGVAVSLEDEPIGPGNSDQSCDENGVIVAGASGSTGGNVPINKLYVTLLNALGCKAPDGGEVTTFGLLDSEIPEEGITNPGELTALKA